MTIRDQLNVEALVPAATVTIVLRASGNLKVAQALARHSNINTISLSAHLADDELDRVYWETFDKNCGAW